jgi:hypothetical protein
MTGGNLAHYAASILLKSVIATSNVRATARAGLRQREQWILGDVQMDHAGNPLRESLLIPRGGIWVHGSKRAAVAKAFWLALSLRH